MKVLFYFRKGRRKMRKINIAIDGPAGSGKGTVAKQVAKKLGYLYVDSGIMYRLLTYLIIKKKVSFDDKEKINDILINDFDYEIKDDRVYYNDEDVNDELRGIEVSEKVSLVAKEQYIRKFLVSLQKEIANIKGVVMDGRDITSVVMKDAEVKIYLDADIEMRAKRRYEQLINSGKKVSFEEVRKNIASRDYESKEVAKTLVVTEDSIVIDSTNLSVEEVVSKIVSLARERIKND